MNLIFLHIPHTAGRSIKRILFSEGFLMDSAPIKVQVVHNSEQMKKLKNDRGIIKKYFVLRPTVERLIGQTIHYSRNLKSIGQVNHLILNDLKKKFPHYDLDNPFQFINLPSNQNVYCKFLLGFTNFNKIVTDNDFEKVKAMFKSNNPPIWDYYTKPIKTPNLEKLLSITIEPICFQQSSKESLDNLFKNQLLVNEIEKLNTYDIKLYNYLKGL